MKPALAAVGSATVTVLSQSSGVAAILFAMRRGHVLTIIAPFAVHVQTTLPWLLLLYIVNSIIHARSVF